MWVCWMQFSAIDPLHHSAPIPHLVIHRSNRPFHCCLYLQMSTVMPEWLFFSIRPWRNPGTRCRWNSCQRYPPGRCRSYRRWLSRAESQYRFCSRNHLCCIAPTIHRSTHRPGHRCFCRQHYPRPVAWRENQV